MENRRAGGASPATAGLCVPGYVAETASCLPDTPFLSFSLIYWGQHVPAQKRKGNPAAFSLPRGTAATRAHGGHSAQPVGSSPGTGDSGSPGSPPPPLPAHGPPVFMRRMRARVWKGKSRNVPEGHPHRGCWMTPGGCYHPCQADQLGAAPGPRPAQARPQEDRVFRAALQSSRFDPGQVELMLRPGAS